MGTETIFLNKENQPETIEINDEVRQADYKYTYSDSSQSVLKSEQADMLVAAVDKFAQQIPLNLEEIFIWYFEQKGVDNPERFLGNNVANNAQMNPELLQALLQKLSANQKQEKEQDTENVESQSKSEKMNSNSGLDTILKDLLN